MKIIVSTFVVLSLCFFICGFGCQHLQAKYHPGGPYYYKCWAGSKVPFRPVDEITLVEAKLIETNGYPYYEAHFNKDGYIESFKKYIDGKVDWVDSYYYKGGIFEKRELKKSDGSKIVEKYDKEGNLVE